MEIPFLSNIINVGQFNFWGIPKNANTSIKIALIDNNSNKPKIESTYFRRYGVVKTIQYKEIERWVHEADASNYITKDEAISNGEFNFTVLRDPIDRFKSQLAYNRKLKSIKYSDISSVLSYLLETPNDSREEIFRSQYSYVEYENTIIPKLYSMEQLDKVEALINKKLPTVNTTNSSDYVLSHTDIDQLYQIYSKDFEIYKSVE
jgi:hypothetical protein